MLETERPISMKSIEEMIVSMEQRGLYQEARYLQYVFQRCLHYEKLLAVDPSDD